MIVIVWRRFQMFIFHIEIHSLSFQQPLNLKDRVSTPPLSSHRYANKSNFFSLSHSTISCVATVSLWSITFLSICTQPGPATASLTGKGTPVGLGIAVVILFVIGVTAILTGGHFFFLSKADATELAVVQHAKRSRIGGGTWRMRKHLKILFPG